MDKVMYCLLAGGRGERLKPLTNDRPKPLVRFGGTGRIIDFTLYNCLASGNGDCLVLTQYLSEMVEYYLRANWTKAFEMESRLLVAMPSNKSFGGSYLGTADAVYQVLSRRRNQPEYTIVLAGDHIYSMNYNSMIEFHKAHGGAVTVGAVECEREDSRRFGIIKTREDRKIESFHEKPSSLDEIVPLHKKPIASMGIYVFTTRVLLEFMAKNREHGAYDFGKDVMPKMVERGEAWAFEFTNGDGTRAYWRDIGELQAYLDVSMEFLSGHGQDLQFDNMPGLKHLPFSREQIVRDIFCGNRRVRNSIVSNSAWIEGAIVEDSIIGPDVQIQEGAVVKNSVLMDGALIQKYVELEKAVVEPYTSVGKGLISNSSY